MDVFDFRLMHVFHFETANNVPDSTASAEDARITANTAARYEAEAFISLVCND
jgi:hypothetical protein